MNFRCPNVHLDSWNDLVKSLGGDEDDALLAFIRHGHDIPDPATAKKLLGITERPRVPQTQIPIPKPSVENMPRLIANQDTKGLQQILSPKPENKPARDEFRRQTGVVLPEDEHDTNNRINEVLLGNHSEHPTVEQVAQQAGISVAQAKQEQSARRTNIQGRLGKGNDPSISELHEFQGEPWADAALKDATLGPESDRNILQRLKDKVLSLLDDTKHVFQEADNRSNVDRGRTALILHDERFKESDITAINWSQTFDKMVPDPARRMPLIHAFQQGRESKWYQQLNGDEKALLEWAWPVADRISHVAIDLNGIQARELPKDWHYLKQWWTNPETGDPYQATYGKFARHGPSEKMKTHESYEAGIGEGLKPATDNLGSILGEMLKETFMVRESRDMYATLYREGVAHANNDREGLVFYPDKFLTKPLVFQDPGGEVKTIVMSNGVYLDENFQPFWRDYRESLKYGKIGKAILATRGMKLAASLFHPFTLAKSELELHAFNPKASVKDYLTGREARKDISADPVDRLLYVKGLKTHGRDPGLPAETNNWIDKIPLLGHINRLIFDYIQPNLKWGYAKNLFLNLADKRIPGFQPTEEMMARPDVGDLARQVVQTADKFFSAEDMKRAALESAAIWHTIYWSPTARKTWSLSLLSSTWQRAHLLAAKNMVKAVVGKTVTEALGGKWDIGYVRNEYLKYLGAATAFYALGNLANYVWSKHQDGEGHMMIDNPGMHKFAVRLPMKTPDGRALYLRPFKSEIEVPEMLYGLVTGNWQKFTGKLSPPAAAVLNQISPPEGKIQYEVGGNVARLAQLIKDLPTPISMTSGMKYVAQAGTEKMFGQALLGTPNLRYSPVNDTLLPFLGIPVSAGPATAAEAKVSEIMRSKSPPIKTDVQKEKTRNKQQMLYQLRQGLATHQEVFDAVAAGTFTRKEAVDLLHRSPMTHLQDVYRYLSPDEALRVFKIADPTERELLKDLFRKKMGNLSKSDPKRFRELWPEAKQLIEGK